MNEPPKKRFKRMIPLIILGIIGLTMLPVLLSIDDWSRDWTENTAAAEATSSLSAKDVAERVQAFAASNSAWSVQSLEQDETSVEINLTRTSPVFRFVDDVDLQVIDTETGSKWNAGSKSRVGKGDLGQNPRNLKELFAAIETTGD